METAANTTLTATDRCILESYIPVVKGLSELKKLYRHFPELWEQLKAWDSVTWRNFRADYSVQELEKRFDFEEEWQKAGKPLRSKAFYSALKNHLASQTGKEDA